MKRLIWQLHERTNGHPGGGRDDRWQTPTVLEEIPASAGMTIFGSLIARVIKPVVKAFVSPEAQLMTDEHRSYINITKAYSGQCHVNHSRIEYARGNVYSNTAESYGALLERAMQGVFHYLSKLHPSRYLNEFGFRWNQREHREHVTRKWVKKVIMVVLPVLSILRALLSQCVSKQLRWTPSRSICSLAPFSLG